MTMTAEEGAWVYEHIILGWVDSNHARPWCCPNYDQDQRCRCQLPCYRCQYSRHTDGQCRTCTEPPADWESRPETFLYHPRLLKQWWLHPSRERVTAVWLADRVCREVCRCDCCHPIAYEPPPPPEPVDLSAYEAVPLFDLAAAL